VAGSCRNRLFRETVFHKRFGVSDFWSRFEFQGRGSTRLHSLYWFETSPKLERFCFDANGLDRIRLAEEWDGHVTAVNPEPLGS
jgi:ATP-dependent DNA helicase PIF1